MGSTFNHQILVEKLAKLNNSQASIETLSHWCIFHMNKAKQVVETWHRQFHCSPHEQRLAFLYLANDILQNSRRKGSEFVSEFWKVLPDAVCNVMASGDEFGRNTALRLIGIWEDRKVFGSRGLSLKEEFLGKQLETGNRNGKHFNVKLKQPASISLDKIVSSYQVVYGGQIDEDVVLSKCRNTISYLEKVDKEFEINSGQFHGSSIVEEVQGQHAVLRECIEQLTAVESSRASLVSYLREALQEQEFKLDQVRTDLQAAQSQSDQTTSFRRQLANNENIQPLPEQSSEEGHSEFLPGSREQSAPSMYASPVSFAGNPAVHIEEDPRKSAAAAVAAKLTASTSSVQMLSYVLSSLASSEGVIGNSIIDSSADYSSEKRPKLENPQQYTPTDPPPPPSSSPPPLPPLPPVSQYHVSTQFLQAAGSINTGPYNYMMTQPQTQSMSVYPTSSGAQGTGFTPYTMPTNSYQSFQGSDGSFYNTPSSSMPMARISRQ